MKNQQPGTWRGELRYGFQKFLSWKFDFGGSPNNINAEFEIHLQEMCLSASDGDSTLFDLADEYTEKERTLAQIEVLKNMRRYLKTQGEGWDDGKTMYLVKHFEGKLKQQL